MNNQLLDIYLTEMDNSDLKKLVKSKDITKIVDVLVKASKEEKAMIYKLVDKKTKEQLIKFEEGGLL